MYGKASMLELTIYGLMGLAAMLVIAFLSAFGDGIAPAQDMSLFDLIHNPRLNDSQVMESGTGIRNFEAQLLSNRKLHAKHGNREHRISETAFCDAQSEEKESFSSGNE
jgi:hypothetical protein